MWTSQVYGHHDKKARTKTYRTSQNTENTKTQQTLRNNNFCVFGCFCGFFIFNFKLLKGLLQKDLNYRLGMVHEKHWGLNQFSAVQVLSRSVIVHCLHLKIEIRSCASGHQWCVIFQYH